MTPAHRIEITLAEDGKLSLERLPFLAGQAVEIIVMPAPCCRPGDPPLRGAVLRYDKPLESVVESEWDVLK